MTKKTKRILKICIVKINTFLEENNYLQTQYLVKYLAINNTNHLKRIKTYNSTFIDSNAGLRYIPIWRGDPRNDWKNREILGCEQGSVSPSWQQTRPI